MIKVVDCATAEDFLEEMSVSRGRLWTEARRSKYLTHDWILRGMTRASWPLQPSAFRPNAFCKLWPGQLEYTSPTPIDQRDHEDAFVMEFASHADQMGFGIPNDGPQMRDPRRALPTYDPFEFPPIERMHVYALAQHYGVPTRLLDWTNRPQVAAYFAVETVARIRAGLISHAPGKAPGDYVELCGVWAVNRGFLENVGARLFSPRTIVVTAPRASNPNLSAQGGLFTLVQPTSSDGDVHPLPNLDDVLRANAANVPTEWHRHAPFAWKFTLPPKEARVALRMLAAEGVHAGTIYPGLAGVVAALSERRAHQWAQPDSRS
ncbi:MAG: FRG domain-containing protein [Kofleriaceae bacterium]